MKKAKRALALALVFALVASFCVTGAAAAPGDGPDVVYGSYENGSWTQTPDGNGTYYDTNTGVTVSKTAVAGDNENEYEVTLQVQTTQSSTSTAAAAATVLVIDTSGSMNACAVCGNEGGWLDYYHAEGCRYYSDEFGDFNVVDYEESRMFAAKEAAKDFIDSYGDSTAARYVGIVSFDNSSSIEGTSGYGNRTYWFDASNDGEREAAKGLIDDLSANGGTDLAGGLSSANSMFTNQRYNGAVESITNRYAVVLTDGEPDSARYAANSAESLRNTADVYTVCFGVADKQLSGGSSTTIGEFLSGSIATPASGDKVYAYDADDGEELQAAFADISTSITVGLTGEGLVVTDPMANGMTADVSGYGISAIGDSTADGFYWTLHNGTKSETTGPDGETITTYTYEKTYTVTVDPNDFEGENAGYYPLNGETYLTIPGEHGQGTRVSFPVPGVWVTPTVSETEQNVYVYVQVVADGGGELTPEQLEDVRSWGLTEINDHGYYTIGMIPGVQLPVASEEYNEQGLDQSKINAVAGQIGDLVKHDDNEGFIIDDKVDWVKLHTDAGADGYDVDGLCWHLNGQITIDELKQELVDVVYQDGVNGAAFETQTYKAYPGTATPQFTGTPEREGYTFTGWSPVLNETVSENGDTYTAQWSRNTGDIAIEVYLDGKKVTLTDENLGYYITELTDDAGTPTFKYNVEGGVIKGTYTYTNYDSADIVLTPDSDYILQGIEGTFIQGNNAWQGITQSGDGWKIDNVMGESTLKVYLNTKYSVEYEVTGSTTIPAPEDNRVYVTGAGVTSENMANVDNNDGAQRSWKNDGLTTKFTIEDVPEGATGWTDEANGRQTAGTEITVSNAVAGELNGDNNIFTFTATANEYTVTYHANTSADDTNSYTDSNTVTHGESYTVLGNTNDYFQYTNTGYTFAGWATSADGGVVYQAGSTINITTNVDLYAKWTAITGTLTVTKTFEGLDDGVLPEGFTITVSGPNNYSEEFTLSNADEGTTYTWTIEGLSLGEYTVTETNYAVEGYAHDSANSATSATATLTADTTTATAELKNVYIKDEPGLSVKKTVHSVNGSTTIPAKVEVDDVIVYKIVVENTGNVALTGISVTDTLGGEPLTVYTDATCETEATAFDLAVDETKELYATYTVGEADAEAGSVTNAATAESGDTTGTDTETVEVKKQYTLTVEYYYDEASGEPFETEEYTLNEGDSWSVSTETGATHVAPETVRDDEYVQFVLDTELPIASGADGIKTDVVVELVYARDEWEDGTPDYKQAWIVYEVADGQDEMGDVDPTSEVVTLEEVDGEYKKTVTADSTATPAAGNVFVNWTHEDNEVSSSAGLDYDFTAESGRTYVFTAHFRAGTTSASVDKQLVSYERDGETVSEIPEGFKALVGDVLNYEISVKNTGEVALNTTVTDTITGAGTLTINDGEGYTVEDGKIIISGLAPEGTVTITASYTVVAADAGKTITNTATADLPGDEPGDDPTDEEKVEVDEYGITVTPADITIYMGGDDGYEAVVGENGQVISDNNTLPTPLFTVELSESFGELSVEQIEAIVIAGTTSDEGTRGWRFDYAGETEDGEDLYYIVPDEGQDPIRVTYTNTAGEEVVSDHFDPTAIDELFAEFAIELYTGTVTSVTATVGDISCEIDYSGTGTLTVRAVDDTDENPVVGVQVALPRPVEAGEGAVTAPAGTTYTLNETTVAADAAGVGLLFDGIIDDGADRTGALLAELESELGVTVEDGNYQAQYLDLVDAHNGNAWVKASGAVTVYWGYPEGTGEDTDFALYHFEGLHREGANSGFDIEDVATSDIERVTITKTANGIAFDISRGGFSPFVLVWDDGDGGDKPWWPPIDPGDDDDDGDDGGDGEFVPKWLNIDDHYAYIIGYEDGTVRPQGNITRAEVATIFFRLLTDEVREEYWSTESGYSDVSSSDWYNNAISTLSNLGVITGYEDGTFRPNASISRAEFVTIATRFFDYTAEYEGTFSDVSYSSWYADFVQAAVDMGLVNGYENGTFRPNASITRAEAVAIVNRVLLRQPDADHLLPWSVMNTFSDNVLESAWYYEDIQEATNSHDYEWLKSGVEDWTEKLPERDWAALEREWSKAYDAPGGEVTA